MVKYWDRLHPLMEAKGISNQELANALGISFQAIVKVREGGAFGRINNSKAAKFFGVSSDWLSTGYGDSVPRDSIAIESIRDEITIPQFNAVGAMGNGLILRDQSGVIESWHVSAEWLNKNVKVHSGVKNLVIVTGFGDSMRPMFNSGDPLLVDAGVTSVEFDAIYFFRVGNEGFIKRLQRIPGDGIRAISENKGYEGWTIKPDMDFQVFGRVLKVWRGEEF